MSYTIFSIVKGVFNMSDATEQTTTDDPKVIIYSTTWCAFCKTEEQYLQKLGVEYIKKDVEEDKEAYVELMEKNGGAFQGVPVTDIAGGLVLGFDRAKIDTLLKEKGLVAA
jgi:glutaredoxin-like YruB-family protein